MNNQWRIENVRNADVIVNYARDRSYDWEVKSPKEYMPDDTRAAVTLRGLTWEEMKLLFEDIGERLDVDCPPAQTGFPVEPEPAKDDVVVSFPMIGALGELTEAEIVKASE